MPVKEEKDMTRIAVAGATGRVGRHVVDVLHEGGHEVVAISRANGVDVISGAGLAAALEGVEVVIDTSTGPSAEQGPAREFFLTATRNLEEEGAKAGVRRLVLVSIIGVDKNTGGSRAAKLAQERAVLAGPIPGRILRAAQFHEFVEVLMGWGRQGDVVYLPTMRTQIVAARTVAEALADIALSDEPGGAQPPHHRLVDGAGGAPPRRDRRPARGVSPGPGPAGRGQARRAGQDRGGQQPGRPGRRAQRRRRPAARPARHAGRPGLRRVAGKKLARPLRREFPGQATRVADV